MRSGMNLAFACLVLGLTAVSCGDDVSDGDDGGSTAPCAVASGACLDGCIRPQCGTEIMGCSDDAMCDAAKDEMTSCVCDAQRAGDPDAVGTCLATFTDTGGIRSTPFSYCATLLCSDPCGL